MLLKVQDGFYMPSKISMETRKVVKKLSSFGVNEFVNKELAGPSSYLLKTPGKLLRPALVFLGADYIGRKNLSEYVGLATSIELLHTSSLIHDDIIDQDIRRRGRASTHVKYGIGSAILAGDALISKAIQEASGYGIEVVESISKVAMRMSAGEVRDYRYQLDSGAPGLREYLNVVELKSSALIGLATGIVALQRKDRRFEELHGFGLDLGKAFQIRDDIVDFVEMRKDRGMKRDSAFRLNVVRCMMEDEGGEKEDALQKAASLNQKYIKSALSRLKSRRKASLFRGYARKVEIRLEK